MTADRTAEETVAVRAELARVDTKAGLLLAVVTAALAGEGALLGRPLPTAGVVLLVPALAGTLAAGWVLLGSVRPDLNGSHGLVGYARSVDAAHTARTVEAADRTETLRALARLAVRKYRRQRLAVDLLRLALVLAAVGIAFSYLT